VRNNLLLWGFVAGVSTLLLACSSSTNPTPSSTSQGVGTPSPVPDPTCVPTGAVAYNTDDNGDPLAITVDLPPDTDPASLNSSNQNSKTTKIYFTVMVPQGCGSATFPVVLNAPGYGLTRIHDVASDGTLHPNDEMFLGLMQLIPALPYYGYVVISFDERGMGDSVPGRNNKNGGGYARVIDPAMETQDARGVLDWAYTNAAKYRIQTEPDTGISKDIKVGTIGISYGAGFQLPLAALDPRIDAIVPAGAWHDLAYSLLPGDAVKSNWIGTLCTGGAVDMQQTALVLALCNVVGPGDANAADFRSLTDVLVGTGTSTPRTVSKDSLVNFFYTHGMNYFQHQENTGGDWISMDESPTNGQQFPNGLGLGRSELPKLRHVPALFLQGNRDVLFNLTEAYWNWRYFRQNATDDLQRSDVRVLSNEGGHINFAIGQPGIASGTPFCGTADAVHASLGWFDHYLKGLDTDAYAAIPGTVCISVTDTENVLSATPVGVDLSDFPVGLLSGMGALSDAEADTASVSVDTSATDPQFVEVTTIADDGYVIAGVPTVDSLTVTATGGATAHPVVAYVGVGIQRTSGTTGTISTILVDDQVTGFSEGGPYTGNHTADDTIPSEDPMILLPAVGERLQKGDKIGLLFYANHPQFLPLNQTISQNPNSYSVSLTGIKLPILIPGIYPGSSLSQ